MTELSTAERIHQRLNLNLAKLKRMVYFYTIIYILYVVLYFSKTNYENYIFSIFVFLSLPLILFTSFIAVLNQFRKWSGRDFNNRAMPSLTQWVTLIAIFYVSIKTIDLAFFSSKHFDLGIGWPTTLLAVVLYSMGHYKNAMMDDMKDRMDNYGLIAARQGMAYKPHLQTKNDKENDHGRSDAGTE